MFLHAAPADRDMRASHPAAVKGPLNMICLAAAMGVLGIAAMRRAHRCSHGHHGDGWHGPFGHAEHGWRERGARMMMHALFRRIDASPAQERAIIAEIEKLQDRVRGAK